MGTPEVTSRCSCSAYITRFSTGMHEVVLPVMHERPKRNYPDMERLHGEMHGLIRGCRD